MERVNGGLRAALALWRIAALAAADLYRRWRGYR